MHMAASWSGSCTHQIQGCGAIDPRPKAGSPLIVIPIAPSVPSCSKLSRCGLAKAGACRKVGATANLDSSCARRRKQSAGRDEETGFQIEQKKEKRCAALSNRNSLTSPIQGLLGVHSRYGLHTRAVTVYRDPLSEGFSHFVTSMTAPVASGWSGCRVGLAPTGKRRLFTAHAISGLMRRNKRRAWVRLSDNLMRHKDR